ncbi:MAG: thioredoxin domain-containing protein [Phycisphaerae bacterium]|nr:thioredoxin domain-containing protein [Phycisphaerae bacterium]
MPKNKSQQAQIGSDTRSAGAAVQTLSTPYAALLRTLGAFFLLISITMSVMLALSTLGSLKLPGCGPGSACSDLSNGFWGSIRWSETGKWPVAYLGLAYFVAVLVAWLAAPGGIASLFRWLIRFGAVVSVGFMMVMIKEWHFCNYCIGAHAGNIAFWFVAEATRWRQIPSLKPIAIFIVAFVVATGGLKAADARVRHEADQQDKRDLEESIAGLLEKTDAEMRAAQQAAPAPRSPADQGDNPVTPAPDARAASSAPNPSAPPGGSDSGFKVTIGRGEDARELPIRKIEPGETPQPRPQTAPAQGPSNEQPAPAPAKSQSGTAQNKPGERPDKPPLPPGWDWDTILSQDDPFKDGFCGLYVKGPKEASVRIVMFTDYQCPDCKRVESEIQEVLKKYPNDVSLSVKMFPFCLDCNPTVDRTLHPNACWAARAAHAAGILWGNDGFWKMHEWLFDRKGIFQTTKILEDGVREIGYDPQGFIKVVTGPETLKRIETEIKEARWCGIYQTPMVFINAHEIRGWRTTNAVPRAVEALLQRRPPARDHSQDRPPIALDKMVGDWRENGRRQMPPDNPRHSRGPEGAPVQVIVYGDFEEEATAETDIWFRDYVAKHSDTQYTWRAFPFNQECNRCMKFTRFEQGCWAARAAEAAGKLKGEEGYWAIHDWLMRNQGSFNDEALRQAATELGFDADALLETMKSPEVEDAIKDDVNGADRVSLQAIPLIIINGKQVGRWRNVPERKWEVLEAIIDEAAGRRPPR